MSSIGCQIHWSVYRSVADQLLWNGFWTTEYDGRIKIVSEHIEKYVLVARAAAKLGRLRPVCKEIRAHLESIGYFEEP